MSFPLRCPPDSRVFLAASGALRSQAVLGLGCPGRPAAHNGQGRSVSGPGESMLPSPSLMKSGGRERVAPETAAVATEPDRRRPGRVRSRSPACDDHAIDRNFVDIVSVDNYNG